MEKQLTIKQKILITIYLLLFSIAIFWFFGRLVSEKVKNIDISTLPYPWGNSISGSTSTGGNILTGIIIDIGSGSDIQTGITEQTNEDYYITFKEIGNYRSFFPPRQGVVGGNYSTNTQVMNSYLSNNTFQFSLPKQPTNGYLYIRLKKATNSDIFIYWHGSDKGGYRVSGNLVLDSKYQLSENEYLYKLNDIPYIRFYDKKIDTYNRQSQMSADNNNYIAGFVREYDGSNQISELTVARE